MLDRRILNGFADVTLDQHALLAHLDLHRPGTTMRIGRLDFGCLLAGQGDLGLRLVPMGAAQVIEQPGLVLVVQRIFGALLGDTGLTQLLEQGRDRHFEFYGKL